MKKLDKNTGLVLVNYKEPLRSVKKGFGYLGALLMTLDGEKLQCHICGKLFSSLSLHINQKHDMDTKRYREKFDLARTTALVSESEREARKQRTLDYISSLSPQQKRKHAEKARINYAKYLKTKPTTRFKIRLETKNKRGTCPDQLLQKIKDASAHYGYTPSKNEFIDYCRSQRFVHLIYTTFGSWSKAVKMAGFQVRQGTGMIGKKRKDYSDEELLEYLQIFYQESGRVPTETDCRRGLIPSSESYTRRWGSFPKAREIAGLPKVI